MIPRMLTLRRGTVLAAGDPRQGMQDLEVRLGGDVRRAVGDVALLGPCAPGDEVLVSLGAAPAEVGTRARDVLHANLTRGLRAPLAPDGGAPLKLAGTSLQHHVRPVEASAPAQGPGVPAAAHRLPSGAPVAVTFHHNQLAPLAWAFHQAAPGARLGYVQTAGATLSGSLSPIVPLLRERGLLAAQLTAGAAYGGEEEAMTTAGAVQHGFVARHWHAAVIGPGPGTVGSGTHLGHAGLVALESAHTAAALGCVVVVAPRRSAADPRPRQQGLSHHTRTMLELALVPFVVASAGERPEPDLARHEWRRVEADLDGYARAGLPARHLGRTMPEDPPFFATSLAAGRVLAGIMRAT
jgi:hypothetical protein